MSRQRNPFPLPLHKVGAASGADSAMLRPQRPVHDAAQERARAQTPTGLGLDSQAVRERMVQRLQAGGISHPAVLQALSRVPRHEFVDTALAGQAYEDTSLPIGLEQTISKPSVVARMLSIALEGPTARQTSQLGRVLEIGTGCGYQAALLALLARQVVSVERLRALHDKARRHLVALRENRVRLVFGDGRLGHAPSAPYDTIIAAAGGEQLPQAWLDQLAEGGRIVAPMHDAASGGQVLRIVDRVQGQLHMKQAEAVHFVPLKSGVR
jgi:protein-L-isoaspartate(D-aspartate) O-methyltransferase